ncbi:MAG: PIN domain-containing protein [Clostridia bacterium]|nr:PIN domain-containing protein [Clostridia bacterium]
MTALIDTCVIIDLLQKREPFFEDAHALFIAAANNQYEGCISAKSVTDVYYLMHRFLHDDYKTRKALDTLFKLFSILDTTELDCRKALLSPVRDYEDALMAETAYRSNVDCIITRNIKDYSKARISVVAPHDFLDTLTHP